MKKKTATRKVYAHLFDSDCMNYLVSLEGETEAEVTAAIGKYLQDHDNHMDMEDLIVLWGIPEKVKTASVTLEEVENIYEIYSLEFL